MHKAVFLDRDGTINKDTSYINKIEDLELLDNTVEGLKLLLEKGFKLIIITNQSGVGRGYFPLKVLNNINVKLYEILRKQGIKINAFYYCPHIKGAKIKKYDFDCSCRKPGPGLLLMAAKELKIDPGNSYMIGDKPSDILAGYNAGVKGSIFISNKGKKKKISFVSEPSYIAGDLLDAAKWILKNDSKKSKIDHDVFKKIFHK